MRKLPGKSWIACTLACLSGCAAGQRDANLWTEVRPQTPRSVESLLGEPAIAPRTSPAVQLVRAESAQAMLVTAPHAQPPFDRRSQSGRVMQPASAEVAQTLHAGSRNHSPASARETSIAVESSVIERVGHVAVDPAAPAFETGTLTINGRTYRIQLNETAQSNIVVADASAADADRDAVSLTAGTTEPTLVPPEIGSPATGDASFDQTVIADDAEASQHDVMQLDLASALAMVGGQHPVVGLAQWRVQEAYARLDRAEVLWLPSIQTGFSFHRHDGNYQASNGDIVDVNRSSFQFGLGGGATGAGTTQRPGLVAQFDVADAVFQPDIAQKNAWAAGHNSNATHNRQLLEVALAYLNLLEAQQDKQILEESRDRTSQLAQLTRDFAEAGEGLQADADRMSTELSLIDSRMAEARERIEIASARLAQAISIRADKVIVPSEPVVVPIQLVSMESPKSGLIQSGLSNRPELKEAQALVAAACDEYKRQKYSPLMPSVLLGFSSTGFGGGVGNRLNSVDDRYDFDALMMWEVRNLGFGEKAARRETSARFQQAQFEKLQRLDEVAREVSEAYSQVTHRVQRVAISERAIETARNSFDRNLSRIRDGEGLPIEVLQSIRALEDAQRTYLRAVADHNESQFRLQWAMGWPVQAPIVN